MQNSKPEQPKRQRGHVRPQMPVIDINVPGRLRSKHVLALMGFSHSTLHQRIKDGIFPKADGKDGRMNYWRTETIRAILASPNANPFNEPTRE